MHTCNLSPVCSVTPLLWIFGPYGYPNCREHFSYCSLFPSSPRRLRGRSQQGTQAHPQSLSRTLSPLLTFPPGPRGGKAQQAEDRTAPRLELFPAVFPQALAASSLNCSRTWEYLLWKFCTTSPRGQEQPTQVLS